MARPNPVPNMDAFDAYFRRADLDNDGRISGAEAVTFFQGSNLPKNVLAQIWMHADQSRSGFLGRLEFYNALKLVTVAQSGRVLTPDIVKAALSGPAADKIPAPQIRPIPAVLSQTNAPPTLQNNAATQLVQQMGSGVPPQVPAFRGLQPPNIPNQRFAPSPDNNFVRPTTAQNSQVPRPGANQGSLSGGVTGTHLPNSSIVTDWTGGRTANASGVIGSQVSNKGTLVPGAPLDSLSALTPSIPPKQSQDALSTIQPINKDAKAFISGNGFPTDSMFGGDIFSIATTQPKQGIAPSPTFSMPTVSSSSSIVPVTSITQPTAKHSFDAVQSSMTQGPAGGPLQKTSLVVNQSQIDSRQSTPTLPGRGVSSIPGSVANQVQTPWPRITQSDVQRYNMIFVEVDTDHDGKITGDQARALFLSWRLSREILKQVWDLSDQDNDSMLSLKEFCTALYLMERYREGRPLPAILPSSMMFDEALLHAVSQRATALGGVHWRPTHGLNHQTTSVTRPDAPATGPKATSENQVVPQDGASAAQPVQQKSKVPALEKHLVNQLSSDEQNALNSKFKEATESEKKVEELEKEIADSKEKIEVYQTRMQELVLLKSRYDSRLNEITERASADRREVESLAKKYEDKCRQFGDMASKLSVDEATFRDIQEKKLEIYNAIVKMEKGGSSDSSLQGRADHIQSDLEGLIKHLKERCKRYGLRMKPIVLVELPSGWETGIQEGAAEWDDDWDKFEDDGFITEQELQASQKNSSMSAGVFAEPVSIFDNHVEEHSNTGQQHITTDEFAFNEDESTRSGAFSPSTRSGLGSPREFHAPQYDNVGLDSSVSPKEHQSNHSFDESSHSHEKFFDEPSWSTTFNDTNDDVDSVWGFNAISSKDSEHELHRKDSFFGYDDMGLNPVRTGSPNANSLFGQKEQSTFFFEDSAHVSPSFKSNSPTYSVASEDHHFGSTFTKFDSFRVHDHASPKHDGALTRFDSIRSTADHSHSFSAFDDTDLFGSTGPFKSDNSDSRRTSDNWRAF